MPSAITEFITDVFFCSRNCRHHVSSATKTWIKWLVMAAWRAWKQLSLVLDRSGQVLFFFNREKSSCCFHCFKCAAWTFEIDDSWTFSSLSLQHTFTITTTSPQWEEPFQLMIWISWGMDFTSWPGENNGIPVRRKTFYKQAIFMVTYFSLIS